MALEHLRIASRRSQLAMVQTNWVKAELEKAHPGLAISVSTTWTGLPPEGDRPQCYTVQPATGPVGIHFTVMDGFIERVDISNPIITTRSGAGVGSSEADLVELFGDALEVEEIPGGRQITFVPTDASDRSFRIIWVTDGQFVVSMRAGRTAIVTPWAPCG